MVGGLGTMSTSKIINALFKLKGSFVGKDRMKYEKKRNDTKQ